MITVNLASRKQSQFTAPEGTQTGMSLRSLDLSALKDIPLQRIIPALLICILAYFYVDHENGLAVDVLQQEISQIADAKNKLLQELDATKGDREIKVQLEKDEGLIRNKINTIKKLMEGRRDAAKFLFNLSEAVPDTVWLREIVSHPTDVTVKGMATDYDQISEFIRRLSNNAFFEKVELKSSAQVGGMGDSPSQPVGNQAFEIHILKREVR